MPPNATWTILFQTPPPSDCLCPVCDKALRAPVRAPCGHHFCLECLSPPATCPTCGEAVESVERDKQKQKEVQQLEVYCFFQTDGCNWSGPLKQLQDHVSQCEWRQEPCHSCGQMLSAKEFEDHVAGCKVITCEYCSSLVKTGAFQRHLQKCGKVIINCPFQCGFNDRPREEVEHHRERCPNAGNVCPFHELGCDYIGDKEGVQQHLKEEPVRHLVMMCDETTTIKRKFHLAGNELDSLEGRHADLCRKTTICEKMYGAALIWRIEDVLTKTNEAKSGARPFIYSPAFISGRFGYKMVASLGLFGDGPNRGKYLAVYVALIRGEYDSVLEWPFGMVLRFTLLDQNPVSNAKVNLSYVVDTRDLADHVLGQPIAGRNAAFGAQKFCPLEKVQEYVKEDRLFLRIDVEQPVDAVPRKMDFHKAREDEVVF